MEMSLNTVATMTFTIEERRRRVSDEVLQTQKQVKNRTVGETLH